MSSFGMQLMREIGLKDPRFATRATPTKEKINGNTRALQPECNGIISSDEPEEEEDLECSSEPSQPVPKEKTIP